MFLTPWYAHVRICAYQGVSTTSFLENLAFVLNERSLTMSFKPHNTYSSIDAVAYWAPPFFSYWFLLSPKVSENFISCVKPRAGRL